MGKKYKSTRLPMMSDKTMRLARFQQLARQYYHNRARATLAHRHKPKPRCSCCGATKNLTSGWSGGVLSWRCPGAASEDLARGW